MFSSEWIVRPVNPATPSLSVNGSVLVPATKPKIVAELPWWKLTIELQVTPPPRPSTKNVSFEFGSLLPTRKFDPVDPSSTFRPPCTTSASSPPAPFRNVFAAFAETATLSELPQIYCQFSPSTGPGRRRPPSPCR